MEEFRTKEENKSGNQVDSDKISNRRSLDQAHARQLDRVIEKHYRDGVTEDDLNRLVRLAYDPGKKQFLVREAELALEYEKRGNSSGRLVRAPADSHADYYDTEKKQYIDFVGGFDIEAKNFSDFKISIDRHLKRSNNGVHILFDVRHWSFEEKQKIRRYAELIGMNNYNLIED